MGNNKDVTGKSVGQTEQGTLRIVSLFLTGSLQLWFTCEIIYFFFLWVNRPLFIKYTIKPHFRKLNYFLFLLFLCLKLFPEAIHAKYVSPRKGCAIGHGQSDTV